MIIEKGNYLTVTEFSKMLSVSKTRVNNLLQHDRISYIKPGNWINLIKLDGSKTKAYLKNKERSNINE